MQALGYILSLPPTPIRSRFVLIEETTKRFYDVDTATRLLQNPESWESDGLSPASLGRDLAIVIPDSLSDDSRERLASMGRTEAQFKSVDFETGLLVAITRREGNNIYADVRGRVNVCPFQENVMSWKKLEDMKGQVLVDELRNGLLERVYTSVDSESKLVHAAVLNKMPRKWHIDAAAMSAELYHMFASGRVVKKGDVRWMLSEDDSDDEEESIISSGSFASP